MFKLKPLLEYVCKEPINCLNIIRGLKTKGDYFNRFGYTHSQIYKGGLLPRPDPKLNDDSLPMPEYRPKDSWSVKKATFGQDRKSVV